MNDMQNSNIKLTDYPKIHAFIAYAAEAIKGKNVEYWMEALKKYHIGPKCSCGQCYTFGLIPPKEKGAFGANGTVGIFGDTVVILHDENGGLVEIELPEITDIPFLDEFLKCDTVSSESNNRVDEAYLEVKKWFENHSV